MIGFLLSSPLFAEPCQPDKKIVIIAPQSGVTTYAPTIGVRGFLCEGAEIVVVRNETTSYTTTAETSTDCEGGECIYTFAALIRDLAPGTNELTAKTMQGDSEISIEIIHTALAFLE